MGESPGQKRKEPEKQFCQLSVSWGLIINNKTNDRFVVRIRGSSDRWIPTAKLSNQHRSAILQLTIIIIKITELISKICSNLTYCTIQYTAEPR